MTLGELITGQAHRDAIHVAISPTVAPCPLYPGQHVDKDGNPNGELVGIVDPFLNHRIFTGDRFWLCLYQNTVTSLRHEWTHPKFEAAKPAVIHVVDREAESRAWIEEFAEDMRMDYGQLLYAAARWVREKTYTDVGGNESYKYQTSERWEDFWRHYSVVTATQITEIDDTAVPFNCAC